MIGCLVIHGYTGGPYELEPLTTFLREQTNWYIKVPVLPGHGTNLALENITYEQWIDTAEKALLQMKEKYDEIYIIGFSMGGMIAAYLAGKYHVDKLVLLAPAGKYLYWKQLLLDAADMVEDGFKGRLRQNRLYIHYRKKLGVVPFKANVEFMKLVKYTRKYLKDVEAPVLIAQGHCDGMVPYKTAYYLEKEISSEEKEVVFFDKSKHLMCLGSDKETLNSLVYQFLKKPVSVVKS
ncbi:alpha/beta fold hydrolase [Virgibacillus sp. 179-BFC.A HS]|uniref:Alpha/beta fold hydrolase n=1 Tax=Tigheibacillus jepli TaxID=3035914 RepID=A0ABU5CKP0_9BACI|nr:alpha/beta fold hydrolase [Virgibacillus sp. 179-BFC.A HS]MDY0406908.1 alpha/beta fold hydrolase [Virgibacillus sp. 179-BFC.A HS]